MQWICRKQDENRDARGRGIEQSWSRVRMNQMPQRPYLHGVESCLRRGPGQRPCHKPLVYLHLAAL